MTYILVILPIFIGLCFAERALVLWQINNITEKTRRFDRANNSNVDTVYINYIFYCVLRYGVGG